MKQTILFLSVLLLLCGCGTQQKGENGNIPVIPVDPTIARTIDLSDISKNIKYNKRLISLRI